MRKTNNLPWMGRTVIVAIMALVGLGVFAGSAAAQTTVYDYDNAAAWWNAYGCAGMRTLLPAYDDADGPGAETDAETASAHEKRVCVMYDMLPTRDKLLIETFIAATDEKMKATHKAWWNAQSEVHRQVLAGAASIVDTTGGGSINNGYYTNGLRTNALATSAAAAFNAVYDSLSISSKADVDTAGDALSGSDGMTATPAVPLVGIGLLGLLLAGRGAWLRRRA